MENETNPSQPYRQPKIPRKDADFGNVATIVASKWNSNPQITLLWTDAKAFETKATAFNSTLESRKGAGGKRPLQTVALAQLDEQFNAGIAKVKIYLQDKYDTKEEATASYARYGMVHRNRGYEVPEDRDARIKAFPMITGAIAEDGFATKPFGTSFWNELEAKYILAHKTTGGTDATVSLGVGDKKVLKAELKETMECLMYTIRANYPKTYLAMYREFGWQKEDY